MSTRRPANGWKALLAAGLVIALISLAVAVAGFAIVYHDIRLTGGYFVILLIIAWLAVLTLVAGIGMMLVGLARRGLVGIVIAAPLAACLLGSCALVLYVFWPLVSAFASLLPEALAVFLVGSLLSLIVGAIKRMGAAPVAPATSRGVAAVPDERTGGQIARHLEQAADLILSGSLEEASEMLEEAVRANPSWAPKVAGVPRETRLAQSEPVSGYALLVHAAGAAGQRDLALKYFRRMLELDPERPGNARQAAREAGIVKEAKRVAEEMGVSWCWWEY